MIWIRVNTSQVKTYLEDSIKNTFKRKKQLWLGTWFIVYFILWIPLLYCIKNLLIILLQKVSFYGGLKRYKFHGHLKTSERKMESFQQKLKSQRPLESLNKYNINGEYTVTNGKWNSTKIGPLSKITRRFWLSKNAWIGKSIPNDWLSQTQSLLTHKLRLITSEAGRSMGFIGLLILLDLVSPKTKI